MLHKKRLKPREAAPQLIQVMKDWLAEHVEPNDRNLTLQHIKCTLFIELDNTAAATGTKNKLTERNSRK